MVYPSICNMIHGIRTIYHKIFLLPTNIPDLHTNTNSRQQHIPSLHQLRRRWNHVFPPNWLMARTSRS